MFIWLPPSEGKSAPSEGPVLDLGALSLPTLTGVRSDLCSHLVRLEPGDRNASVGTAPCAPAREVYTGVLFAAAALGELDTERRAVADQQVRIFSGLFGALSPADMIPDHKLPIGQRLPGLPGLPTLWRPHLNTALGEEASGHTVLDCRSGPYRSACPGAFADMIELAVLREHQGRRQVISHDAKRWRGMVTGVLLREWDAAATASAGVEQVLSAIEAHLEDLVLTDAKGVPHRAQALEVGQATATKVGGSQRRAILVTD